MTQPIARSLSRPSRPRRPRTLLLPLTVSVFALIPFLPACGSAEPNPGDVAAEWRAERDTIGDTVVVRTVSGSAWGDTARLVEELRIGRLEGPPEETFGSVVGLAVDPEGFMYVVDRQVPVLRVYDPDGSFLRNVGSEGSGPGEYERPDGGVAVLPDGRILLRDPAGARINVYGPDGSYLDSWRIRGGRFTSRPLYVDVAGNPYHAVFEFSDDGSTDWWLVRFGENGERADSLYVDRWKYDTPRLEARFEEGGNRSFSVANVPFTAGGSWTFSPGGYLMGGVSTDYEVELMRRDAPVLRIVRDVEPVPVLAEEKANHRERATASMRNTDPEWTWDGPPIPDTKAPYRGLMADDEGRIWVRRHTRSQRIPEEELEEADGTQGEMPPLRWEEPLVYDVFGPDGRYLGPVRMPDGFGTNPQPVIRGDEVWAVARDELDVQYVVRYRLEVGGG